MSTWTARRLGLLLGALLGVATAADARALVWPDVAERIARDMTASDPATRRAAARDIANLGPKRGGPLALAALADPDDDVRLAAADAAIELRASGATDAVVGWLNAPDVRLRRKACDVARTLPSPRAVPPLARTLGDPDPEVRSAAAEALGHQTISEAVPPLLGRLDDPTPAVRIQVIAALARLADGRAVVPLVGKIQDSSSEVRQTVARALGELGDGRASTALILALRDPNEEVRREALTALGRLASPEAVDAIAPFASDRSLPLRLAAVAALGRIASPEAVRVLVKGLGQGDDGGGSLERSAVRDALVAAGVPAVSELRALLGGSPSPAEATSAAWALGELHARTEAPLLVRALRQGTLPVPAALHALAGAGSAADVPVVLEFLADPSPGVRAEALGAAAALLDPEHPDGRAVEPVAAALRDPRPGAAERARLASLLGRTGAPRAAPLLAGLAHAADMGLRISAVEALGVLGPAGADDALLDAMGSPDPTLRLHAAVALSLAGGPPARDLLVRLLDEGVEVDRSAALTALGGVLERAPTDDAVARLSAALALAAGAERDALIEAIGRSPTAAAVRALAGSGLGAEPSDRREAATLLAAHPGDAGAAAVARTLLSDVDSTVRAQAAWSLGSLGAPSDVAALERVLRGADLDGATNAAAAIGRIAARARSAELAARALCPLIADPRTYVRANALAALALAASRCDGAAARKALAEDPSEDVRRAAALLLWRAPGPEDIRALERCARSDPSGAAATRCLGPSKPPPARAHPVLVYVVAGGATPAPGGAYALLLADGLIHSGTSDRRGAVFDPSAPEGEVTLRPASALAR